MSGIGNLQAFFQFRTSNIFALTNRVVSAFNGDYSPSINASASSRLEMMLG